MVYFTQAGVTNLMTLKDAVELAQISIRNKFKFKIEDAYDFEKNEMEYEGHASGQI